MSKRPQKETPDAAQAFNDYCLLGPVGRTLEKLFLLYQERTKDIPKSENPFRPSLTTLKNWSSTWGWQARVIEWENQQALERAQKQAQEIAEMNKLHIELAQEQQTLAVEHLKELKDTGKLPGQATVQLLDLAIKLERLARGAATERQEIGGNDGGPIKIQQEPPADLSALSDEEFDILLTLNKKIKEARERDTSAT